MVAARGLCLEVFGLAAPGLDGGLVAASTDFGQSSQLGIADRPIIDLENLDDKFIHLTNDAIQKQGEDFGKFENCNKLSYSDFQRYLNQYHGDLEIDVLKHIVP